MVVGGAPALVSQLLGHTNTVNKVLLVPNDTAIISVSDDRFQTQGNLFQTQTNVFIFFPSAPSNSIESEMC